jgi:hypothetical protein
VKTGLSKHVQTEIDLTIDQKESIALKAISPKQINPREANQLEITKTGAINIAVQTKIIKTGRAIILVHQQNN